MLFVFVFVCARACVSCGGQVRDWSAMLSLGEQQRLAFGRLLANQPRCASAPYFWLWNSPAFQSRSFEAVERAARLQWRLAGNREMSSDNRVGV